MTREEMTQWCLDNELLFTVNKTPTQEEAKMVFHIANQVDETQNHRLTSCGRCWSNAKRAIIRELKIFN